MDDTGINRYKGGGDDDGVMNGSEGDGGLVFE